VLKGQVVFYYKTEEDYIEGHDPLKGNAIYLSGREIKAVPELHESGLGFEIRNIADPSVRVWQMFAGI